MTPNSSDWGIRLLMITLGLFLILRSVTKDTTDRTLIDHILGKTSSVTPTNPVAQVKLPGGAGSNVGAGAHALAAGIQYTANQILAGVTQAAAPTAAPAAAAATTGAPTVTVNAAGSLASAIEILRGGVGQVPLATGNLK